MIKRPQLLYGGLLLALAVAWVVPQESLLSLSVVPRFVLAVLIAFAPIFLANLVFAQRFRDVGDSSVAFAANLLGAMVGGVIEYVSLITGYRALLIVVAGLYGLAFLTGRRKLIVAKAAQQTPPASSEVGVDRVQLSGAGPRGTSRLALVWRPTYHRSSDQRISTPATNISSILRPASQRAARR